MLGAKTVLTNRTPLADDTNENNQETVIGNEILGQNLQVVVAADILEYFSKVCRCCLSEKNDLEQIFIDDGGLAEMIMAFAAVQVNADDVLPTRICGKCADQVSKSLAFKQQIETADATLRHYMTSGNFNDSKLVFNSSEHETQVEFIQNQQDEHSTIDFFETTEEQYSSPPPLVATRNDYENDPNVIIEKSDSFDESSQFFENTDEVYNSMDECPTNETILETTDHLIETQELNANDSEKQDYETCTASNTEIEIEHINMEEHLEDNELEIDKDEEDNDKIEKNQKRTKGRLKKEVRKSSRFKCNLCKRTFVDQKRLSKHKTLHGDKKTFFCRTCPNKGFYDRADLNRHISNHTHMLEKNADHPYKCSECKMGFNVERDLKIHSSIHSKDGRLICTECGKQFSSSNQIKRHVRTHFEDKPHKCRVCSKGFSEMGSLTRHFRRHTGEQREKKHECQHCHKKYYDTYSLNVHIRHHTGEKPWVCTTCGKGFVDSRLLNSHLKIHSDLKPFSCKICDKCFTHQSTLTTHLRTHTGEKPYICSVCGKTFIQSSNLSLHMRVHSGEKPYKCEICDRCFASSCTLLMHIRTHTGEKPYTCDICNKSFARHDLTAHMRTHTGEKPFECSQCGKRFTTSGQLNQHIRTHTGEKPYKCDICTKGCSSSSYLKKHKKIHHKPGQQPHQQQQQQQQLQSQQQQRHQHQQKQEKHRQLQQQKQRQQQLESLTSSPLSSIVESISTKIPNIKTITKIEMIIDPDDDDPLNCPNSQGNSNTLTTNIHDSYTINEIILQSDNDDYDDNQSNYEEYTNSEQFQNKLSKDKEFDDPSSVDNEKFTIDHLGIVTDEQISNGEFEDESNNIIEQIDIIKTDDPHVVQINDEQQIIEILPGYPNEAYVSVNETQYVRLINGQPTEIVDRASILPLTQ